MTRRTLKRTALALLGLILLLAVFHRPILFRLTRYFVIRAAEKQHLDLAYEMSGSIFTNLKITNLRGIPTEPGPVERLQIGSLRLEYSLWGLVRKGLPGLLEGAALTDAHIVIDPSQSLPPEKVQKKQSVKFPALIPERISVENLNVTVRQTGGDFVLADFDLLLHPERDGSLRVERVAVPGFRTWTRLDAAAVYAERNLVLRGLALGPEIQVERLSLDMSRLMEDALAFGFDGALFGGAARLSGKVTDLNESNVINLGAELERISFAKVASYFGVQLPITGALDELNLLLTGQLANPETWTGDASLRVVKLVMPAQLALDDAKVLAQIGDGKATIRSFELTQGNNKLTGTAQIDLPKTLAGFAKLDATGTLKGDLSHLAGISAGSATGAANVAGTFRVADGQAGADLRVKADHVTFGKNEINDADLRLKLGKKFRE